MKYTSQEKKRYIDSNIATINSIFKEANIQKKIEIDVQRGLGANVFLTDLNGHRLERLGSLMKVDQLFHFIEGLFEGMNTIKKGVSEL